MSLTNHSTRLDVTLVQRRLAETRTRARQLIVAEQVQVNGITVTKPAYLVSPVEKVTLAANLPFVSRGGLKLQAALQHFGLPVSGLIALDVGASTGGFTDCLLQHGAAHVFAVDVGHSQFAPALQTDPRVTLFEKTDIRAVSGLPLPVDLAVIDVSFISLRLVLPAVKQLLKPQAVGVIALIKPQFEAGPGVVGKKGVIKSDKIRTGIVDDLTGWLRAEGWQVRGVIPSPVVGGSGNVEFLAWLG